ncbi:MAG: response regulator [Polyangia bacterium]
MSRASRQLLERFQASALERLRRIASAFWELSRSGDDTDERTSRDGGHDAGGLPLSDIVRELHTMKGESRMLGLRSLSEAVHQIEDGLALATSATAPGPIYEGLARGLTQIIAVLKDAPLREMDQRQALHPALQALREITPHREGHAEDPSTQSLPGAPSAVTAPPSSSTDSGRPLPSTRQERWIQVAAERIDALCGVIGELASTVRGLHMQTQRLTGAHVGMRAEARSLLEDFERCQALLDDVESAAWAMRLVPLEGPLHELAAHARELAQASGKQLRVHVQSGGSQIERTVLDTLWEPLVHLVRNAVDHGVEAPHERAGKPREAELRLHAESVGPTVTLVISDDGRGVSLASVRSAAVRRGLLSPAAAAALTREQAHDLLFHQGFSTRSEISELSGRGVGLDIVRSRLNTFGGAASLSSTEGAGTKVSLSVPVRLSKERALVLEHAGMLYALPARSVLEMFRLSEHPVKRVAGGRGMWSRYGVIPLRSLAQLLTGASDDESSQGLVLRVGEQIAAFSIPRIVGEYDLLRRPCDALVAHVTRCAATATLDDGRLVLWLAPADLIRTAAETTKLPAAAPPGSAPTEPAEVATPSRRKQILVVDDSAIMRTLLKRIFASHNLDVRLAADGQAGFDEVERALPDVALIDAEMPGVDGLTLLTRLRERWPELPVAMFSGHSSPEHRDRALALGADEYLVKTDLDTAHLIEAITRLLAARRGRR